MSTEIIKKDSNKRVWSEIRYELKVSGICGALLRKSHFKSISSSIISITLPCSKAADLEEQEFCDDVYRALEDYFKCSLKITIHYNDGTELCQE